MSCKLSLSCFNKKNNCGDISVNILGKNKLLSAVKETIKMYNFDNRSGYEIILESDLPIGKGMASSTADMTAAIIATAILNDKYLSEDEIAKILLKLSLLMVFSIRKLLLLIIFAVLFMKK